jgi:hypothetical protein
MHIKLYSDKLKGWNRLETHHNWEDFKIYFKGIMNWNEIICSVQGHEEDKETVGFLKRRVTSWPPETLAASQEEMFLMTAIYTNHSSGHHVSYKNKKFWEELILYFPLARHGPHIKRRVQQSFYYCVCTPCRGKVFTEPFLNNDRGIHIQTHRLMREISELLRWDGLSCHDIHTKFHKDFFRHSKLKGGKHRHTDRKEIAKKR